MSEKPLAELSPRDIESQLNLKAGLTRGIPELAVEVRRRLEQGEHDRQDRERLDWMEEHIARFDVGNKWYVTSEDGSLCGSGKNGREAIDAARAEGK